MTRRRRNWGSRALLGWVLVCSGAVDVAQAYTVRLQLVGGPSTSYRITAVTDAPLGLALWGTDVVWSAGSPAPMSAPAGMVTFVRNNGLNNPAGYGGTVSGSTLLQVGGAQNTINNTTGNAPYPVGVVVASVGYPAAVDVATGGAPPGTKISLENCFAGVITGPAVAGVYPVEAATTNCGTPIWIIIDDFWPLITDSWVSRLEHQTGTFFDIGLSQAGGAGKPLGSTTIPSRNCERRIRGTAVGYKLRCTFDRAVNVPAGSVTATPGNKVATITNVVGNTWEFTFAGANALTNMAKNTITVSTAVTDAVVGFALGGDRDVDLYLLQGNVANAGDPAGLLQVNTTDKSQLILKIGQTANLTNFWFDISNVGTLGSIDSTDKSQLILKIGNQVVWP